MPVWLRQLFSGQGALFGNLRGAALAILIALVQGDLSIPGLHPSVLKILSIVLGYGIGAAQSSKTEAQSVQTQAVAVMAKGRQPTIEAVATLEDAAAKAPNPEVFHA